MITFQGTEAADGVTTITATSDNPVADSSKSKDDDWPHKRLIIIVVVCTVGGTLLLILIIVAVIALILCARRRRQRNKPSSVASTTSSSEAAIWRTPAAAVAVRNVGSTPTVKSTAGPVDHRFSLQFILTEADPPACHPEFNS